MRQLKAGLKLKSAVCETQVMVIRTPAGEQDLRCGGVPMIDMTDRAPEGVKLDPAFTAGTLIGKRYVDEADTLELLCTRGGRGGLSLNGAAMGPKQAKPLPSSD
jgi:hypothetical protein